MKVVYIPTMRMPSSVERALIAHEYGHAIHDGVDGIAPSHTEEVRMHELTGKILDHFSGGAYLTSVRSMAQRTSSTDIIDVMSALQLHDFTTLDDFLQCRGYGQSLARLLVSQYVLSIGFAVVELSHGDDREKARVYAWWNKLIDTNQ